MDERVSYHNSKMTEFSNNDQRADFWKVRLVSQNISGDKIYFFPSLLEWLKDRPQCVLNSALVAKEAELGIQLPDKLAAAAQKEYGSQGARGDPVTAYIGGYTNTKPSTHDIVKHLQRSYLEMYERNEHCRSRELVSLIDASLLLGVVSLAQRLSEENNYEHDLLQLHHKLSSSDTWDEYKTSVMLRLSRGGAPSPEVMEAATITSLMCDLMAGPSTRRMSAIAQMAANGLKLDAMVLAKLYFPSSALSEQLSDECSSFFEDPVNSEAKEIAEMIGTAAKPFFNQHLLRFADQLSCYRILRIDFALNEKASLEKKLVGRLEISKNVRYVIAHALAYRNFEAIALITEDAVAHLDKYSFFTELEQIVYPIAIDMLSEAVRMIFHAKPASVGWKKQRDEGDKLGHALQQHPNGYFGGLVDMWIKRGSLIEISKAQDVYRQHSLLTSIEGIASVLRNDDLLNPVCRGMLLFACDLVCSVMEAVFGDRCRRIHELIKTNPCLEYHTGDVLVRRLTKGVFASHTDDRLRGLLNHLCDPSITETALNKDAAADPRTDIVRTDTAIAKTACSADLVVSPEEYQKNVEESVRKDCYEGVVAGKRKSEQGFDSGCRQMQRKRFEQEESMPPEATVEPAVTSAGSEQNSEMNDNSSVAPSRSVCEQVATMMEGVKYCRERERGANKNAKQTSATITKAKPEIQKPKMKEEPVPRSFTQSNSVAMDSADQGTDRIALSKPTDVGYIEDANQQDTLKVEDGGRDTENTTAQMRGESPIASNGTECAQIISDDHLDFSSTAHGPSVKTRWLPGDATTSSDKSGEEAVVSLQNAGDEKPVIGPDIVTRLTVEVADASNVPKEIVSTTAKFSDPGLGALESSVNNDEPRGADCSTDIAKEGSHLQPPLSPAPVEDGRRSPHHRHMVDRGKAMIQKLLTEGNNVNCRPRLGSERQCDTYTKAADENLQKTRSFADFTDENMDQSIPFRATREDVFCTSSQESINEDANASFDDDIAAAFTHPLQTVAKIKKVETHVITTKESKPSEAQVTATPTNTPSTPLLDEPTKQELFTEEDLKVRNTNDRLERDEHDGFPNKKAESEVTSEPPHFGDNRNLNESGQDSTLPVECAEPNKTTSVNGTGNEFAEVTEKTSGQVEDSDYPKSHVLEAIQEKSEEFVDGDTSTVKERELESVRPIKEEIEEKIGEPPTEKAVEPSEERPPQKKFMSGGFGSSGSSGFVSFGSSAAEKENVAAFGPIEFHSAEKSGGFDGERGGGGFGRGDQRGGRGRSFDRDGQRFRDSRDGRDSYRDRDGRDGNRDGFRSRGGYGGGGGRDSQGRSGFRGSRM